MLSANECEKTFFQKFEAESYTVTFLFHYSNLFYIPFPIHHFSDLGDQYASIFKDSLHSVAVMKDGKWYIK